MSTDGDDRAALRRELRELDERLFELREELEGLWEEMRDYDDSPTATTLLLQQQALIEALDVRRADLAEQLGEC
jgi:chromosome segregation ATPase